MPEKISYLKHSQIDKQKWNNTISDSANRIIYAYSWYLDVVCPGWEALVSENYETVFPLTCRSKFGIRYLFPPFFTQQLGVFSKNSVAENTLNIFLERAAKQFSFIEINLNAGNIFKNNLFEIKKNRNHLLKLNSTYTEVSNEYSENLRRNLKKAKGNNLEIKATENISSLTKLFRKNKGGEIPVLKNADYNTLQTLATVAVEKQKAFCCEVYSENNLIAGAFFLKNSDRIIFLFSANSEKGKQTAAIPFLIDKIIEEHAGQNIIFDFEGSNDTNLARFYKSFGSEESVYLQIKKNNLPLPLRWIKK